LSGRFRSFLTWCWSRRDVNVRLFRVEFWGRASSLRNEFQLHRISLYLTYETASRESVRYFWARKFSSASSSKCSTLSLSVFARA